MKYKILALLCILLYSCTHEVPTTELYDCGVWCLYEGYWKTKIQNAKDIELMYWGDILSSTDTQNDVVDMIVCEIHFRYLYNHVTNDSVCIGTTTTSWKQLSISECAKYRYSNHINTENH